MRDEHVIRERRKAWNEWKRNNRHLQSELRRMEEVFVAGFDAGVASMGLGANWPPEPEPEPESEEAGFHEI